MRLRICWASFCSALVLGTACFPSLDGLTGSANDAGQDASTVAIVDTRSDEPETLDAGRRDGESDGSANDASGDGGAVFVPNGSFETLGNGCGPGWNSSNATLETSPNSRTGDIACRICRIGNPGAIQSAPMTISAGPGNYRLSVWIRNSSTHLASPTIVTSLMAMKGQTGLGGVPKSYAPQASYGNVLVEYTAPATTDNLVVQLQNAAGADGSCFVIDDIAIERLP